MGNPFRFYIELVDGSAFDKAESGQKLSQFDVPVLPLLFPWVGAAPMLAFLSLSPSWQTAVFTAGCASSVACWSGFAIFYYRRVRYYRGEFGADDRK